MKHRTRQSGFTLLEFILAAAMVAIIGLTLYSAMSIGFRARTSAQQQVRAVRQASIAMDVLQQDLQSVLPPTGILAGPFIGYAMGTVGAEADSMEFYAIGRDAVGGDDPLNEGIRKVQLILRTDVDPPMLVRRVERNLLAATLTEPADEPLARDVRAFSVRYFNGYGWLAEWDSTVQENVLPLAVEISIELNAPSPQDASRPYRLTQVIPLACGRFIESADPMGDLLE